MINPAAAGFSKSHPGNPASSYDFTVIQDSRSLRQYAADQGLILGAVRAEIKTGAASCVGQDDSWLEKDGTLCVMLPSISEQSLMTCKIQLFSSLGQRQL